MISISAWFGLPWKNWSNSRESRLWRKNWRKLWDVNVLRRNRSEEHTSELQSLMRISYAVFCLKKKKNKKNKRILICKNYKREKHKVQKKKKVTECNRHI